MSDKRQDNKSPLNSPSGKNGRRTAAGGLSPPPRITREDDNPEKLGAMVSWDGTLATTIDQPKEADKVSDGGGKMDQTG